jgi:hypothetical protein
MVKGPVRLASFKEYLKRRWQTDTPEGDFVTDFKRDRKFPEARTWQEVESHLVLVWRFFRNDCGRPGGLEAVCGRAPGDGWGAADRGFLAGMSSPEAKKPASKAAGNRQGGSVIVSNSEVDHADITARQTEGCSDRLLFNRVCDKRCHPPR